MKKRILVMLITIVVFATQSSAAMVSMSPAIQEVAINDTVLVDVVISGLENLDVGAFDLDLGFDDTVLAYAGYSLGDQLGNVSLGEAIDMSSGDLGSGIVDFAEVSWISDLSFQADSIVVVTVSFTAVAEGSSGLNISIDELGDNFGDPITASVNNGSVVVVPEPVTLALMALAGVGLIRRNRK